nr:MAG TPA: hypothetical protein [Caudoviricetes sp.]
MLIFSSIQLGFNYYSSSKVFYKHSPFIDFFPLKSYNLIKTLGGTFCEII